MIEGAVKWSSDGGSKISDKIRSTSADYLLENDDLALWMEERCVREGEAKAGDLYVSFADWKRDRGEHACSQTAWGQRMVMLPGITKRVS